MTPQTVGWIGAGRMGAAMVRRLLAASVPVVVWNRTPSRAAELVADGASTALELESASSHRVVFTSLAGPDDLRAVIEQVLAGSSLPSVLVDTSTVSTTATAWARARCIEAGVEFLAAPVSGNPTAVAAGGASFVCSGSSSAFEEVRPLLEIIGRSARYVGAADEAPLLKLCHNLLLATLTQGIAEIAVLCEAAGVSRAALMEFLNSSALGSPFTAYKTPMINSLDMTATFTTQLLLKDLGLGLAEANRAGVPLQLGGLAYILTESAVAHGYGELDFCSLLLAQAEEAGVDLAPRTESIERTP